MSMPLSAGPDGTDLRALPACPKLARAVGAAARSAMTTGKRQLVDADAAVALEDDEAKVAAADLREILGRGAETPEERDLLSQLLVLYAASDETDPLEGARLLVWTTAATDCDALGRIDSVLGDEAASVWNAVALVAGQSGEAPELQGEVTWAPRGPVATVVLVLSGLAFIRAVGALIGRYALGLRRPGTVRLSARGLELAYRVDLLGRPLRERRLLIPMSNLASVAREVRFARAGTYAGLGALVLGTYLGVSVFADGARAPGGSPTLILLGLAIVALGLALDFGLTNLLDVARKKVRLVIFPVRGRPVCIMGLAPESVDTLLQNVAQKVGQTAPLTK